MVKLVDPFIHLRFGGIKGLLFVDAAVKIIWCVCTFADLSAKTADSRRKMIVPSMRFGFGKEFN